MKHNTYDNDIYWDEDSFTYRWKPLPFSAYFHWEFLATILIVTGIVAIIIYLTP